jgi:membrane-bound lytic murein transglycosylase MltF
VLVRAPLILCLLWPWVGARAADLPASQATATVTLPTQAAAWTGDFDGMLERRLVRVVVPYSRTLYYNDKGREGGITAELLREFERYINKRYRAQLDSRPITLAMLPTAREDLLANLGSGTADIAAGNLTVTPLRLGLVDIVAPDGANSVSEIALIHASAPPLQAAEDLSGRTVHVRKSSSYYESLAQLHRKLVLQGRGGIKLQIVPDDLEDEDLMEMLDDGLLEALVIDDWKAKLWAPVLRNIRPQPDAVLRRGGQSGWAIRKNSPLLHALIEDFHREVIKQQSTVAVLYGQQRKKLAQVNSPTANAEWRRFEDTLAIFTRYGRQYGFDPLLLIAQGYQESRLNQRARSASGAIGIMQVLPTTGAAMKVGDIHKTEPNIHAGVKYLHKIMDKYFADADLSPTDRTLFAFAAYNAGPTRVARLRRLAAQRDLDANRWFNSVELLVAEKVGMETTTYVRNIYKYYVAYSLALEQQARQKAAREKLQSAASD